MRNFRFIMPIVYTSTARQMCLHVSETNSRGYDVSLCDARTTVLLIGDHSHWTPEQQLRVAIILFAREAAKGFESVEEEVLLTIYARSSFNEEISFSCPRWRLEGKALAMFKTARSQNSYESLTTSGYLDLRLQSLVRL